MTGTRRNLRDSHRVGGVGWGGGLTTADRTEGSVKRVRATSLPVLCSCRNTHSLCGTRRHFIIYIQRSTPFLLANGINFGRIIQGELFKALDHVRTLQGRPSKGTGHPTPKDVHKMLGVRGPTPQRMCTNSWGSETPHQRMCTNS